MQAGTLLPEGCVLPFNVAKRGPLLIGAGYRGDGKRRPGRHSGDGALNLPNNKFTSVSALPPLLGSGDRGKKKKREDELRSRRLCCCRGRGKKAARQGRERQR
ncbi:hypothetical protein R1flu_020541 [Riccia fluitans]|uniref:Uncharacterized protein n=1 Tax=Riccia fluitans TaxID=41844 RepID=A0ABD1ZM15_9MARC